jgi:hypothetical protein
MVQDSKSITAIQHINNKGKKTHDYRNWGRKAFDKI